MSPKEHHTTCNNYYTKNKDRNRSATQHRSTGDFQTLIYKYKVKKGVFPSYIVN